MDPGLGRRKEEGLGSVQGHFMSTHSTQLPGGQDSKKDVHIMVPSGRMGGGSSPCGVVDGQDKTAGQVVAAKATMCGV